MKEETIKKFIKFRDDRNWKQFHTPENLAKSISIESSELLECFQWSNDYKLDDVKEELADVLIYSIAMADVLGLDIDKIINDKLEINKKKYPIEKSKGRITKYYNL
ncbi:nucleotide pyrophosphohydrolase [Methanobrevibacter filiformis]|uniref:MazG-like family protein n=1 Tax=Methanobrevibacter filiformis TaxID=55758 RepID=A0A162FHY8_9EURY|nr:nucleotide pyrophosphohydrolase [Methanobrevibacter filiformis]KZX10230.1 MazG-like family protein [Methanobrevibacter filiformis]